MTEPLYARVATELRGCIASGVYPIGSALPSTRKLCSEFDVSVTVARAAVAELRSERLVRGQPGKAVYVVATPAQPEPTLAELRAEVDALRAEVRELHTLITKKPRTS